MQMGYGKQGLKLEWPDCSLLYVANICSFIIVNKKLSCIAISYCIEVQDFDMPNVIELATNH